MLSPEDFYAACNLKENPFRSNPAYAEDPRSHIWVGYKKEKQTLVKYLERSRSDQVGNINFLMIYGTYGTGKSHALVWAQHLILHKEREVYNSACYLIPTLRKDKGRFTFAGAFVEDIVSKSNLVMEVLELRQYLRTNLAKYRDEHKVGPSVDDEALLERMIPVVELNSFAKAINACSDRDEVIELLAPRGLNDYQAMVTFTRLVNLFVYEFKLNGSSTRFRRAAYLFIDELDDLQRVSSKEAREVNDLLRHIYDLCPNCFGLVISLSGQLAELPAMFEDYVLRRIQRYIHLQTLDKDDAIEFVKAILDQARPSNSKQKGFFPFDEGAIDTICSQVTGITPGKIVNVMQQVIEEVRLSNFNPAKEGIVTQTVLEDRGILDDVLVDAGIV